jgi:hypothetical protein
MADAQEPDALAGPFLTGVEVDVDQWRQQTIAELETWLADIQNRKTSMGDPLVDFPEGWDSASSLSQKQQLDVIGRGLASMLTGPEAREAQVELQAIRAQGEKLRQLEKILGQFSDDDDEQAPPALDPADEDLLNTEIVIPRIDLNASNPFEIPPELQARLREIDEKLGITGDEQLPTRPLDEINDDLLKLYQEPQFPPSEPPEDAGSKSTELA